MLEYANPLNLTTTLNAEDTWWLTLDEQSPVMIEQHFVGVAWSNSMTPVNIMSGFRKAGAYPRNPGVIDDRQVAPSFGVRPLSKSPASLSSGSRKSSPPSHDSSKSAVSSATSFTPVEEKLYQRRYEEGYDLPDSQYAKWLAINHPQEGKSCCSLVTHVSENSSASQALSEVLKLPEPTAPKRKRKPGFNTGKSVLITNDSFLEKLISEDEKMAKEEEKKAKALERERKKRSVKKKRKHLPHKKQNLRKRKKL